jgi:hypothetical protein
MSTPEDRPPTEEELRAAYEAELKRLRVEDVVVQTLVSLINLGGRKAGLVPGAEDERDLDQVRQAVDAARALLPIVEPALGPDARQLRDALSQLQLVYAREAAPARPGQPGPPPPAPGAPGAPGAPTRAPEPEGPGPAQRTGRLWIPGQ